MAFPSTPAACKVCGTPRGRGSAKGLCNRCYKAQRRGQTPSPERKAARAGEGDQISIRFTRAALEMVDAAAAHEGISRTEYVRRATLERLMRSAREGRGRPDVAAKAKKEARRGRARA